MLSMDEMFYSKAPELWNQRGGHMNQREVASSPALTRRVPTVELCVPICCMKCEKKVREAMLDMDDVAGVICDQSNQKVTVTGNLDPLRVLKKVKRIKTRSQFWTRSSSNLTYESRYINERLLDQSSTSTKLPSNKAALRAAAVAAARRGDASFITTAAAAASAAATVDSSSYTTASYNLRRQFMHHLPSTLASDSYTGSSSSSSVVDQESTYAMSIMPPTEISTDNRHETYNNQSIITNPNYLKRVLY